MRREQLSHSDFQKCERVSTVKPCFHCMVRLSITRFWYQGPFSNVTAISSFGGGVVTGWLHELTHKFCSSTVLVLYQESTRYCLQTFDNGKPKQSERDIPCSRVPCGGWTGGFKLCACLTNSGKNSIACSVIVLVC